MQDLNDAISLRREALTLRPDPDPGLLNNLALVLNTRFHQVGDIKDVNEAISLSREALVLQPAPHPKHPDALHRLAIVLSARFVQNGEIEDVNEAITLLRTALHLVPPEHPRSCSYSLTLGKTFIKMYSRTKETVYQDDAVASFRASVACKSAPASLRFTAACFWADSADANHDSALEAYQHAIELLPRMAMLGLDLQSRQQMLASKSDGVARNAAACAIRAHRFDKAVEILEEGRAIFWSQALQLRTLLEDVHSMAPELAQRLQHVSHALEQVCALRDVSANVSNTNRHISLEQENAHHHRLNEEWLSVLEEVRKLDGLHDFLRPKTLHKLQAATSNGPVVILNAAKSRCDALIVTCSGVSHVALPNITFDVAKVLVSLVQSALSLRPTIPPLPEAMQKNLIRHLQPLPGTSCLHPSSEQPGSRVEAIPAESNAIFQCVLAELWISVVQPVVSSMNLEKSTESLPRLWWCPTGPFSFLPIHAAGKYGVDDNDCLSNYAVSSYIPTLSKLLVPPPPIPKQFKMAVVIQQNTSGCPLPCAYDELQTIKQYVPGDSLVSFGVTGNPAYIDSVLSCLPDVSIAHFACHRQQDWKNPLDSALILEDGHLKVSRIMEQSLPNASLLAFLSACQMAQGDRNVPDEAIHLAASLLFAGFGGVVATTWTILDSASDGPTIAGPFYETFFKASNDGSATGNTIGRHPDTRDAALSLHLAVAKLRSETSDFVRWVPFVHFGL